MRLVRFGDGDSAYNIPAKQVIYRDNFRDVSPQHALLFGHDGGFDLYASAPFPAQVGRVEAEFWIEPGQGEEIHTLKDNAGAMVGLGERRLYIHPKFDLSDQSVNLRWCFAKLERLEIEERVEMRPHTRQRVRTAWVVGEPVWLEVGNEAPQWGVAIFDVDNWGSSTTQTITGISNDIQITIAGNVPTPAFFQVTIPATKSSTNLRFTRIIAGAEADDIQNNKTFSASDVLIVDCKKLHTTLNGADNYDANFVVNSNDWFMLDPGANTIRVRQQNAADEIDLKLLYNNRYR